MLDSFLQSLHDPQARQWDVAHHEIIPERAARTTEIPEELDPRVKQILSETVGSVYSHQAEAIRLALSGRNVALATETASGKSLAFQAAVLDRLVRDPSAGALFLFPLKALERDQRDAFLSLAQDIGITAAVYDGDTPDSERRSIRKSPPRVIITNPDMLHLSFLAFHDTWRESFAHLCLVVLDEVHTYKGIFGSHVSRVLLRMRRVCRTHGVTPRFFACSATIANPGPFVSTLIGDEVSVVNESGAQMAQRHFIFLNPVLSAYTVAARLFSKGVESGLKTIVFTRARKITELITTWVLQESPHLAGRISSYRAGFLPQERRDIEAQLFSGKMDGVISTSALEMGIDVGGLDLCILVGYPGTIINTWQRGGRVGRGGSPSAIVLIAGNDALDQYFLRNPENFFQRSCEEAVLDPLNTEVLKRHIPCAAAEIPVRPDEEWVQEPGVRSAIEELVESRALYRAGEEGPWHSTVRRPQRNVDLRGIGHSYGIFIDKPRTLIGSSSGPRVFKECHEGAVYLHRTRQYVVTKLDLERRNVIVTPQNVNYYTRARSEKDTEVLGAPLRSKEFPGFTIREAHLKVTERVEAYEKRRTRGQDLIGVIDLDLPRMVFETVGIWIEIPDRVKQAVQSSALHFMGGIHALEHAAIALFPLYALCDRDDVGGISTPDHEQVCKAAVFLYDGHPGGVGLAHRAYDRIEDILKDILVLVQGCPCEEGCPSCIHSPKCGSGNKPLDKQACMMVVKMLLDPESIVLERKESRMTRTPIFPDLTDASVPNEDTHPVNPGHETSQESQTSGLLSSFSNPGGAGDTNESPQHASPPDDAEPRKAEFSGEIEVPPGVVVFDLETKRLADEVGGWGNISKMGLSLGVVYCRERGFVTFTEDSVDELLELLLGADLIVGFNQMRFDHEVLSAYTNKDLRALPNLDILVDIRNALGFRLKLDQLASATLGTGKSGDGLAAVQWFREGKMDLLERYCRDDVRVTRDLYAFGLREGHLLYRTKGGTLTPVQVDWRPPQPSR